MENLILLSIKAVKTAAAVAKGKRSIALQKDSESDIGSKIISTRFLEIEGESRLIERRK